MAIPEKTESEIILFRFTAYLQTAISNSVNEYYRERQRQLATEQAYSAQFFIDAELEVCIDPHDFSTAISENDMLDRALSIPVPRLFLYISAVCPCPSSSDEAGKYAP